MGQPALKLNKDTVSQPVLKLVHDASHSTDRQSKNGIITLAIILCILQILDGILTGIGVYHFGIEAEGNPLLKSLMNNIGYTNTLILTKGAAIGIVLILVKLSTQIRWIPTAMKAVIALYMVAAIIPWSYILTTRLLVD